MNNFKVGDVVSRRLYKENLTWKESGLEGQKLVVTKLSYEGAWLSVNDYVSTRGDSLPFRGENFELAHLYANPPHKHAEHIKAWADGAEIQFKWDKAVTWHNTGQPEWQEGYTYRIKPTEPTAKERAQTKLEELMKKAEGLQKEIQEMNDE